MVIPRRRYVCEGHELALLWLMEESLVRNLHVEQYQFTYKSLGMSKALQIIPTYVTVFTYKTLCQKAVTNIPNIYSQISTRQLCQKLLQIYTSNSI